MLFLVTGLHFTPDCYSTVIHLSSLQSSKDPFVALSLMSCLHSFSWLRSSAESDPVRVLSVHSNHAYASTSITSGSKWKTNNISICQNIGRQCDANEGVYLKFDI
jgi:hypothetical protein